MKVYFCVLIIIAVAVFERVRGQDAPADGGGSPSKMAAGRMNMACSVQPNSTVLEWFAQCLGDEGLPYTLPDVFKPCTDTYTGTNDLGSWDGIWDITCMNKCSDKEKLAECIVDNIKKKINGADIVKVSADACLICEKCVDKIGKRLRDGAGRR